MMSAKQIRQSEITHKTPNIQPNTHIQKCTDMHTHNERERERHRARGVERDKRDHRMYKTQKETPSEKRKTLSQDNEAIKQNTLIMTKRRVQTQ